MREEAHVARMETVKRVYIVPLTSMVAVSPVMTEAQINTVFRNWKDLVGRLVLCVVKRLPSYFVGQLTAQNHAHPVLFGMK